MQLTLWDTESIGRLQQGDEGAWIEFIPQALTFARRILAGSVDGADLDDECFIVILRALRGLPKWDPTRGQSLKSYVYRKALDQRIRYSKSSVSHPKSASLDSLSDDGVEQPEVDGDVYVTIENRARSAAIQAAMTQLDARENVFLRLRERDYPLSECAYMAGYSQSDSPENIIRRVKRKFARLIGEQPFFRDNPDELALIGECPRAERNEDE